MQDDLKDGAHEAAGGLRDEHHVGDEREAVELQLRDVRLQEDVDLRGGGARVRGGGEGAV